MSDGPGAASAAEMRAVLRAEGHEPPPKGVLGDEWVDIYEGIAATRDAAAAAAAAAATGPEGPATEAEPPPAAPAAERAPRRPRQAKPGVRDRLRAATGKGKGKGGKGRRASHPRVSVDKLVSHAWAGFARMVGPVSPPVSRCLQYQAPFAGAVLEDTIRGTVVDRALQPLARAEDKGRVVAGLLGPPLCVAALEHASTIDDARERAIRQAMILPILRETLVLGLDVAGPAMEKQAERDAEYGPLYDQADTIIAAIFAPPTAGPDTSAPPGANGQAPPSADDEATAQAQQAPWAPVA